MNNYNSKIFLIKKINNNENNNRKNKLRNNY